MSELRTDFPALEHVRVGDCMHQGVLTCYAEDSLRDVAAIMANHRVHAVVVTCRHAERPIGVVSDLDVLTALATGAESTAAQVAASESLTVSADATVQAAAQLMSEHGISHLVILDPAGGYPVDVLSSLDIVAVYAGN
jgi:CBS domain-containing protein